MTPIEILILINQLVFIYLFFRVFKKFDKYKKKRRNYSDAERDEAVDMWRTKDTYKVNK